MSDTVNVKKIKPAENYGPIKDTEVQKLVLTVAADLLNNTNLANPPVDPTARTYMIRIAQVSIGAPGNCTVQIVHNERTAVLLNGLTPRRVFSSQACAMHTAFSTHWSAPVALLCIYSVKLKRDTAQPKA